MNILVVDDDGFRIRFFVERFGQHNLKVIESVTGAIDYLEDLTFSYIFLDYDLGDGNGTGLDVVKFLYENPQNPNNTSNIIFHSWNITAFTKIQRLWPKVMFAPFNTETFFDLSLDI